MKPVKSTLGTILVFFFSWKAITFLLAVFALRFPLNSVLKPYPVIFNQGFHPLVWTMANFDGSHYLEIALRNYMSLEYGFFPLYPIVIRLITHLPYMSYLVSGLFISHLCFIGALYVIIKLLKTDQHTQLSTLVLSIILFFPTSFFYGAAYNDSLFFLLATLTLLHGRRQQWLRAGFFGALATLARLNGLALFFFLIIEYYIHLSKGDWKNYKKYLKKVSLIPLVSCALIPLAFVGYLAFVHIHSGSFSNIFSSMKVWHQDKLILPPQVVWRYLKIVLLHPEMTLSYWVALAEFAAISWYSFILLYSIKKIRGSYWIFFAFSLLIPSLTGTFQGMPRYGLHLYPFFLGSALFLSSKSIIVRAIYFIICGTLLGTFIALFTRGYFIS